MRRTPGKRPPKTRLIFADCLYHQNKHTHAHTKYKTRRLPADFFQECLNAEEGEGCDFLSYVVARGVYDQNGNLYDNNEWEMRESIFLTSYEEAVKNPDITDEEVRPVQVDIVTSPHFSPLSVRPFAPAATARNGV